MKNIILISPQNALHNIKEVCIHRLLEDNDIQIVLLVVASNEEKEYYKKNPRIINIITFLELEHVESTRYLDYEMIKKCRHAQLQYENFSYRFLADYALDKYYYYVALSYWLGIFEKYQVNLVINTMIMHGRVDDCIPNVVASVFGVKMFFIETIGYNDCYSIVSDGKVQSIFTNGIESLDYLLNPAYDKTKLPVNTQKKTFYRAALYKIGGNLLEDFCCRLLAWNWHPRAVRRQRYKALWSQKFLGYIKLKWIQHHLDNISHPFVINKDKYIFYALHFEPEATIQVRVILESQLAIIKMLSEALPKGWKLYVKEHPAQFGVNNDIGYEYLISTSRFKTKRFYDKISSFENVKIIDRNISSHSLIQHAQAVSSIVGTVLFEAVKGRKPMIMFSDRQPLAAVKDAFNIHSFDECVDAIDKIKTGFMPNYYDIDDVLEKYVFIEKNMPENLFKLVQEYCNSKNTDY